LAKKHCQSRNPKAQGQPSGQAARMGAMKNLHDSPVRGLDNENCCSMEIAGNQYKWPINIETK
jgi:hypothetical protein